MSLCKRCDSVTVFGACAPYCLDCWRVLSGRAAELRREIEALEATEHLLETNQGTYSAAQACARVGTGDPRFADRNVTETVGGERRETGPGEGDAPGYQRRFATASRDLLADRKRLAALRKELAALGIS